MGHARIAPSSAGRWVHCPGSILMEERYPDRNEDTGDEGTACHWAAAEALLGRGVPSIGTTAPNGVILTAEIVDAAKVYVNAVAEACPGIAIYVEQPITVPSVHPDCWGTPDCWWFDDATRELHVADLKYGWLIVEAYENWQLLCYVSGVLDYITVATGGAPGIFDQSVTVVLHVIQPRPYHVLGPHREWRISGGELRGYVNRLAASATESLAPNPRTRSGAHCKFCPARHACPASHRMALSSYEYTCLAVPEQLPAEALAAEWQMLQRASEAIKYRLTGIEGQIAATIEGGGFVPGLTIDRGEGRAVWSLPAEEIFALGDLYKVQLRSPQEPVTVAQAKKLLPVEIIRAFSSTSQSGMKIVPTTKSIAARAFGSALPNGGNQ